MEEAATIQVTVKKIGLSGHRLTLDELAIEEPLEIQLEYGNEKQRMSKSIAVTMRTPANDEELAVGFLFTEGIITEKRQVTDIRPHSFEKNKVIVSLSSEMRPNLDKADRNFYTTSGCGICGKSSIDAIRTVSMFTDTDDAICVSSVVFYQLQNALRKQQPIFENTGGLHAAALFDIEGNLLMIREDVGRHNALDKLIGTAFMENRLPLNNNILLLSGRASFELIQKAVMAGIKIVAAVGAPSSLAVQLAEESGTTLVGFLREDRFNIYNGERRIEHN